MVKRNVLSVWGKGGMKRNELSSVPREHLGRLVAHSMDVK